MLGRDGATCLIIEPSAEWLREISGEVTLPSGPAFLPGNFAALANYLQGELRWSDAYTSLAVEGLALELAASVSRTLSRSGSRAPAWLRRGREYLREHYRECPPMTTVATMVGVHPVHFSRAFRQHYGCPPGQFLRRMRLETASNALAQSELTILEIALDAGFADHPHFTKAFSRLTGQTPAEYRRAARRR